MQAIKSSILHKFFVVLLTSGALFTGSAWLANYRFPLAVLQTIGIVDKVRLDGVNWRWYIMLRNNDRLDSYVMFSVAGPLLSIRKNIYYTAKQPPAEGRSVRFGVGTYRLAAYDFTFGPRFQLKDGTTARRKSLRRRTVEIPLRFLWPLFATYPIWFLVRGPLTLRYRRKHGLCLHCGYSLKNLVENRCPECGSEIEKAPSG